MGTEDTSALEGVLADWLVGVDEALASGRAPLEPPTEMKQDLRCEFEQARACLRLLEEVWPRSLPNRPAFPLASVLGSQFDFPLTSAAVSLGRFQVLRELGRGGCGIVFLAFDPVLGRRVALKVPRIEHLVTPELRQRFLHEARAAAGLDHPHIVPVYEAGDIGAVAYIASAFCPGSNLAEWLRQRVEPVPLRLAAAVVAVLAEAVAHAHARGIWHRDLKPANVLLPPKDGPATEPSALLDELPFVPKLTDFGLAKLWERELEDSSSSVVVGTPLYMAPEQAEGRSDLVDQRTDVYALGAMLYELLVGRAPFQGATVLQTLDKIRKEQPAAASRLRPEISWDLETICMKCLQKEPGLRYATADELAQDLRRFLRQEPIQARPPSWLQRVASWCRRPERIHDVGWLATALGVTLGSWCVTGAALIAGGVMQPSRPGDMVLQLLSGVLVLYLPMVWIGRKTLQQRAWAPWLGLAHSAAFLTLAASTLFGWLRSDGGGYFDDRNPELKIAFNLLLFALVVFLTSSYVVALVAQRANRSRP